MDAIRHVSKQQRNHFHFPKTISDIAYRIEKNYILIFSRIIRQKEINCAQEVRILNTGELEEQFQQITQVILSSRSPDIKAKNRNQAYESEVFDWDIGKPTPLLWRKAPRHRAVKLTLDGRNLRKGFPEKFDESGEIEILQPEPKNLQPLLIRSSSRQVKSDKLEMNAIRSQVKYTS